MIALHHVQLACPPGGEDAARDFWVGMLGLVEVEKPAALAGRGGCWFRSADGAAQIHVGVEQPFAPQRKAHPALVLDDAAALDAVARRLRDREWPLDESERETFPGHLRLHTEDAHGNRVEILAPAASDTIWP